MFDGTIETEQDLRNIGLSEISNLLQSGHDDISEGILFFRGLRGTHNYIFYSIDDSVNNADVLTIQPNQSLTFSLIDAARYAEARSLEKGKLLVVPLDNFALSELERHFAEGSSKINGFEVYYRQKPLIEYDLKLPLQKGEPIFVGRYAFDPVENAKRARALEEMRQYFIKIFSDPKYS